MLHVMDIMMPSRYRLSASSTFQTSTITTHSVAECHRGQAAGIVSILNSNTSHSKPNSKKVHSFELYTLVFIMVHYQNFHKRQQPAQPSGTSTVENDEPTGASLSLNPNATDVPDTPIPLAQTTPTITLTPSSSITTPDSTSSVSSQTAVASSANSSISLGTVIGACVGALAGAILLILLGLWIYKRTAPKPRERTPISPLAANRNARGEHERTRSRMEFWDKLEDGQDMWDQTKEVSRQSVGPMENLNVFKKSPSMRTAVTEKYQAPTFDLDPHPFAQYHPNLAKEMASEPEPAVRSFLGRVDAGPALSWDSGNASSFLSLHSRISGAMSSEGIAIPTPNVTTSSEHRWESAEVLHYDGETAQVVDSHSNNPFDHAAERRKSFSNPFFGAQSASLSRRSSLRSSIRSSIKGREQDASDDPFADDKIPDVPKLEHVTSVSTSSVSSNDRALQSLLAALDFPAGQLRITSMQPSVYSSTSMYTEDPEEDDVTDAFPLPPGVNK